MSVELVYETHSISEDNEAGIATGWLPGRLSAAGRESARELGRRRRDGGFAVVISSDLARAVETMEIAFEASDLPRRTDPRLREVNYGSMNGMSRWQLDEERSRRIDVPFPDGESYRDVVQRMRSFLEDAATEFEGQRVLVIGHAATRFALDHLVQGTPLEDLVDAPFEWQEGWTFVIERRDRNGDGAMGDAAGLVRGIYDSLARDDVDGVFDAFGEDGKVFVPGATRISGDHDLRGARPVVEELVSLEASGTLRREILDVVTDGANVFVVAHEYLDVDGREIGYHILHNWWVENGKVSFWWFYLHEYDAFEKAWAAKP